MNLDQITRHLFTKHTHLKPPLLFTLDREINKSIAIHLPSFNHPGGIYAGIYEVKSAKKAVVPMCCLNSQRRVICPNTASSGGQAVRKAFRGANSRHRRGRTNRQGAAPGPARLLSAHSRARCCAARRAAERARRSSRPTSATRPRWKATRRRRLRRPSRRPSPPRPNGTRCCRSISRAATTCSRRPAAAASSASYSPVPITRSDFTDASASSTIRCCRGRTRATAFPRSSARRWAASTRTSMA